jgi:hypothetical protein
MPPRRPDREPYPGSTEGEGSVAPNSSLEPRAPRSVATKRAPDMRRRNSVRVLMLVIAFAIATGAIAFALSRR